MKIFGIGTDIVKISRIKRILKKKSFKSKIFNLSEISKCQKTKKFYNCYAKRYAAKEAFSKALGTGIAKGISFNEIIVKNDKNGKPHINLQNTTKNIVIKKLKKKKI